MAWMGLGTNPIDVVNKKARTNGTEGYRLSR